MFRIILTSAIIAFMSATSNAETLPQNDDIELRGIFRVEDVYSFSLHMDSRNVWRTINQTAFGFKLVEFSPENATLTLRREDGLERSIVLKENENISLEVLSDSGISSETMHSDGYESIDPNELRDVHLVSAREKIQYSISPRGSVPIQFAHYAHTGSSLSSNGDDTSPEESNSEPSDESTDEPAVSNEQDPLTDLEKIALSVYEKHHVPVREPPTDVDVFHTISPR